MKKILFIVVILTFILQIQLLSSELIYIDSIENNQIYVNGNSLFVQSDVIYYFDDKNGFYSINKDKLNRLFENELSTLKPSGNYYFARMTDTSLITFAYGLDEVSNGIIIKDNDKWTVLNSTNSSLSRTAPIYDIIFGYERELVIINTTGKISFVNAGVLNIIDCGMDFECMPQPFDREIGFFYNGCYWYVNSKSNFVKLCNKIINSIIPYQDFGFDGPYLTQFNSFQIHQGKMFFSSYMTNSIYSIYNDKIEKFSPLSDEQNKELRFESHRPLYLISFIFGNDGYLYVIYKESNSYSDPGPAPAGRSKVIKMTKDFDIIEILPVPQQFGEYNPFLTHLVKDESDITNKKVYIGASKGFYIYDPEPTSVLDDKIVGTGTVFLMDIFPNPSGEFINVSYGADIHNAGKVKLFLSNLMGIRVKEYESPGVYNTSTGYGNCRLDVSSLPTGCYQLVITDGNSYNSKNIMVMR